MDKERKPEKREKDRKLQRERERETEMKHLWIKKGSQRKERMT